ncbi:huntingtin-like isoform X2 [Acropora palmata]|uniref:huntingtin-like isoform X2 n=1 Tax=Acropora palmata TaxID=6131 RepID=UPI003DA18C1F
MSLAAADKLLKVFDALKNFREGIPGADPNPLAKKKESLLSKKDRILLLNNIPGLTCSPSIRNLGEFSKILAIAVDTLLISCDDGESDVRFVAGECLNKLIKGSMDTSLGRIHVELYKEMKKNGPARSLRAALSRFGELCHLIRPQKCRPFIANLLPCIARISLRTEDAIQETLANAMQKIMGVLGSFTSEAEVKQLLKTFLPNLRSSSATTRRTAASCLAVICCHSRKPNFVSEWLLNILLGMVLPFQESRDSNVYLGVLICLRHMIPNLDKSSPNEHSLKGLRGSFGNQRSYSGDGPQDDKDVKSTQLLQAYEVIMHCTKHQNHNVVTAALETLLQLLRTPPLLLLSVLLSSEGITPSARTETFKGGLDIFEEIASESDSVVDESDTASIAESTVSTVDTGIGSSVANDFDGEQITADEMLQSPELDHLRLHGDSITSDAEGLREVDEGDLFSSSSMQGDLENRQLIRSLSDPGHMVDGQDVANVDTALNESQDSGDIGETVCQKDGTSVEVDLEQENEDDIMRTGSLSSDEVRQLVQRSFQIDSVACSGIPLLHCARLMCSFLLSGNPGEMLSDSSVRVSVKSLALLCIAQVVRLHPEAFLARMLPESSSESGEEGLHRSSPQLVRDVLLFSGHGDPQLRGSLAAVIGNVIRSGLEMGRLDFDMWCIDNCQELETVPLVLEDLISVLKTILQDESSVAIRQACISLKSCLSLLCSSKHSRVALDLLDAILSLRNNSYWLVKVELLEILEDVDFRQLMFLTNKLKHQNPKRHRLFKDSLQDDVLDKVLFHLLEDDDIRVRQAAAKCFANLVPRFFFSLNNDAHSVIISAAQSQISCLSIQDPHYRTHNQAVINSNLSRVVLLVTSRLNHATSRTTMLGCVHLLSLLAETFPVTSYPDAWGCGVSISCRSPLPTHSIGPFSTPSRPSSPSASCTGGGGPLSVAVGSMISSWLAYDLFAHQQLLKISGRLLFGAGCSGVHASLEHHSEQGSHDEPNSSAENWSVFTDSALAPQAEKLIYHLVRLLNILTHVIDHIVPGALPFKLTFPGQNKDKQTSAAIPGVAAPQVTGSSSAGTNLASAGPKRILTKSKRALSEADLHQAVTAEKPASPSKSQASVGPSVDGDQMTQGPPPKSAIGAFHHLPHYMKLYEITKGAFANNQLSLVDPSQDKFCQFLSATLESLSLLLEVTAFSDIGKHVEEILGYLQVCIKLEATKTTLCVQQLLRTMFGINALCQPILVHNPVVPPCLAETNITVPPPFEHLPSVDEQLYHSCFVHPLSLIAQTLDRLKPKEESKDKSVEVLSGIGLFIRKLKKKSSSSFVRPKMKLDKQSPIHSFIRWFEPLVIRALKEYTLSSSITLQQQVLSLLTQLIKLRVNYSLLDADQLFISFVQKQFEYIDAGQIKSCDTFLPHIFQFLVLLSYECFQPKFHEPQAIVGMPRIIQLCDGIMAGGQPPQTHAIPALQPIIYDLFVLRTAGKSDGGQGLETQREVVLSMLLRLVHYSEVLEMLVTVVNCYQRDEVKWKSLSGQIIDLLLPLLANQKVHLESEYGIKMLQNLFAAVAPGSLWPVDVLLRVLFCDVDQMQSDLFSRWLATTLVVLQTLMAYVSEDILLSRIDQSGFRPSCANKPGTQLLPIEVFVKFLFHVVEVTASRIAMIERSAEKPPSEEFFIFKLFSLTLTCLTHLLKSANFKKVSQLASSSTLIQPSLEITNECVSSLVDTRPAVVLLWCQVLRHVKYTDDYFWCGFIDSGTRLSTASTANIEQDGSTLNKHITRLGVVLIYCDLLIAQQLDLGMLNLSQAGTILKLSLEDLITMCREPPVQEFLSLLCSTPEGSKLLLDSVSSCRSLPEAMKQPSFMCDLLFCLRTVHASQTLHFIRILVEMYFDSCHLWVVQMAEREIRKKLEMLQCGGQNKESSQDLGEDELRSVCQLIASTERAKRNSSLMSTVNKILQSSSSYVERELPCNEDLASAMDNYTVDREWFRRLAEQRCFASHPGDPQTKSVPPQEAAKMLSVLNASEVSDVINRADFDVSLLEQCILRGIEGTLLLSARRQNPEEAASDPYDFTETAESIDIDNLSLVSKLSLFSRIEEIVKDVIRTRSFRDSESSTKISCFCLAVEQLSTLCNDATWCRKVTCLARALVAFASAIPTLPKYCDIPESGRQSLFHFIFIPLAVVHHNFLNGKRPCSTVLTSHLECLAKFLNLECCKSIGRMEYFPLVSSAIDHVHVLLNGVCGEDTMEELCFGNGAAKPDGSDEGIDLGRKACSKISVMVHRLLAMTKPGSLQRTSIPQFLVGPFRGVVVGLARQPLVNSYARCPPLVWKLGWDPAPEGPLKTELPPIPIEILKEKDVLDEFVRVVNFIGWTSRQQFEETWAALLGVISSPPLPDTVSIEEDMESTHSCCLAVRCISELLLQTTLYPVPGNPTVSSYLHRPRHRDLPFLGSRAGKKLTFVRGVVEEEFATVCCTGAGRPFISDEETKPGRSASINRANSFTNLNNSRRLWLTNRMLFDHPLYGLNIERVLGFHEYTLGQISVGALYYQAQIDLHDHSDSDDDTAIVVSLPRMPQPEKLDIKSCEQFLLELFEQWMSLYIQPKTPLALISEATKALLVLSDLFVDGHHFEWVLETLLELHHNHSGDDLLIQYLLPTLCKAAAFLKTEGVIAEKVCTILESSLRSPHVPLQISALYGAMYLLELHLASVSVVLLPILTEFLSKKLVTPGGAVSFAEHHLLVMWSTAFYLLEKNADEISDQEFKANILKSAVSVASSNEDSTPTCVYHAVMRGLERLVVSFALSSAESDSLVKLSVDRLSMQNPQRAISALGLLVTCMYTGKIGDRVSGIYPQTDAVELPTEDRLLVAMERVTVLFDRIRKGISSEAKVVARVLPALLLDFFPAQEIMNKVIGEFLSSQQPHPELIAQVLFKVFEGLHNQGLQTEVRDWVLLSLGSFVQRTPLSMAVWSLSCFFVSASNNKWIRALFSLIMGRMGRLQSLDVKLFCATALDFFRNQNLDSTSKEIYVSTFSKAAATSAPYRELLECCLSKK